MSDLSSAVENWPVLVHLSSKRDERIVAEVLSSIGCEAKPLKEPTDAVESIEESSLLLLDQERLDRKSLAELGMALLAQKPWSDLPIMVITVRGIPLSRELKELAERTNLVFIERPLRRSLLKAMLRSAIQTRKRQFHTRKLMDELESARQRAEAAARAKSAFLSQMSHDIRTPLTSILGFAEILHEQIDPSLAELSEEIVESGQRLMETMNSVLELARLEGRRMQLTLRPLRLIDELKRIERIYSSAVKSQNLNFELRCDPDLYVQADASALGRVLMNVVGNAVKFTQAGGIEVTAEADGGTVQLLIRDSGIGVSQSFIPKAFEAFQREAIGVNGEADGSGLGLTITKRLVELMQGAVTMESRRGSGTTVSIRLPQAEAQGAIEQSADHHPAAHSSRAMKAKPRVLFVEDNPSTRNVIRHLTDGIMDATIVAGFDDAVAALSREHFELGFIDINLGESRSGEDLLEKIKSLDDYDGVPFVAFTAFVLPEELERFMDRGFVACLNKPFTRDELVGITVDALDLEGSRVKRAS